jgi:hypothetical protein
MSKESIRIDCMSEILEELGISASNEQIKEIVDLFVGHLEFENEQDFNQFSGSVIECDKCKSMVSKINQLNSEIEIYKTSVKNRRKTDNVWIENGEVMYSGRS